MIAALAGLAAAHVPVIYVTDPSEDWCAVLNGTIGNDVVMLRAGEYRGPCRFEAAQSDVPSELTTVQSLDPLDHAVFVGSDGGPALTVVGERALVLELTFRGPFEAIRLGAVREAWVRQVDFEGVTVGVAVDPAGGAPSELHVTDSAFRRVGVAVDLGADAEIADTFVDGAAVAFQVRPGAVAALRDNVAVSVGVGLRSEGRASLSGERYVAAEVAAELGRGEVVASVLEGPVALRGDAPVAVVGSTVLGAVDGTPTLASCAVDAGRPLDPAALGAGSVDCAAGACFVDRADGDLYPARGSPLLEAGVADPRSQVDWCGSPRGVVPTAGAFEWVGPGRLGPLRDGFKRDHPCERLAGADTAAPAPGDTAPPLRDTGPGSRPSPADGSPGRASARACGCAAAPPAPWALAVAAFAARRRRAGSGAVRGGRPADSGRARRARTRSSGGARPPWSTPGAPRRAGRAR